MKLSLNRLEDMLLSQGSITKEQHKIIRDYIIQNKVSSTVAITQLKIMDINSIYRAIAKALNVEFVPIGDKFRSLNEETIALLSENICKLYSVLPWELNGNELKLLIENPQDTVAIKEVQDWTGKKVIPVMAVGKQLKYIINTYFEKKNRNDRLQSLAKQGIETLNAVNTSETIGPTGSVRWLNLLT